MVGENFENYSSGMAKMYLLISSNMVGEYFGNYLSEIAKMHELTKNLKLKRQNDLSVNSWRKLFNSVKDKCENIHKDLPRLIEENLNDVEKNWPKNLPKGIIHADLFHDNIFFIQDKFSGVIDFYFSCEDFFAFEIAICFNALCFDGLKSNLSFNVTKAKNFIDGYVSVRKLSHEELNNIKYGKSPDLFNWITKV